MKNKKVIFYLFEIIMLLVVCFPDRAYATSVVDGSIIPPRFRQYNCDVRIICIEGYPSSESNCVSKGSNISECNKKVGEEIYAKCCITDSDSDGSTRCSSEVSHTVDGTWRYSYLANNQAIPKLPATVISYTQWSYKGTTRDESIKECELALKKKMYAYGYANNFKKCTTVACGESEYSYTDKSCATIENECQNNPSDDKINKCILKARASCCSLERFASHKGSYGKWKDFIENTLGVVNPQKIYDYCDPNDYECDTAKEGPGTCCEYFDVSGENAGVTIEKDSSCCKYYKQKATNWKDFVRMYESAIRKAVEDGYTECSDCDIDIEVSNNSNEDHLVSIKCKLPSKLLANGSNETVSTIKEIINGEEDCLIMPDDSYPKNSNGTNVGTVMVNNESHSYCTVTCVDSLEYTYPSAFSVATGYRFTISNNNSDTNIGSIKYQLTKTCTTKGLISGYNQYEKDYKYLVSNITNETEKQEKINTINNVMAACVTGDYTKISDIDKAPELLFTYTKDGGSGIKLSSTSESSQNSAIKINIELNNGRVVVTNNSQDQFKISRIITWTYSLPAGYMNFIDKMTGKSYNKSDINQNNKDNYYETDSSAPIDYSAIVTDKNDYSIELTDCGSLKDSFCDIIKKANSGKYECTFETNKGLDITYRSISLTNPFPGISGKGRTTGSNWCDGTDCNNNNDIVNTVILREGESVYNKEPLYSITLTPSLINKIREYNDKNEYGDFNLKCKNGINCKSNFIWEEFKDSFSGCVLNESCSI